MTSQNQSGYSSNTEQTGLSDPGSSMAAGSDIGGTAGGIGGHAITQTGPVEFSNMNLPGLSFPAGVPQIQQALSSLPQDQQQQWQSILPQLPADTTYNSIQELQQACQQVAERQFA